jgi:hypothetical protein
VSSGESSDIGLGLVRKALERHIAGGKTPTVLFEALSNLPESEDVPGTPEELLAFVQGALRATLESRLGKLRAEAAIADVEALLESKTARSASLEIDIDVGGIERTSDWPEVIVGDSVPIEEDPFAAERPTFAPAIVGAGRPLRVLIVARTARLAQRIRASFGGHRVTVSFSTTVEDCAQKLDNFVPDVVIVDAQDAARIEPIDLAVRLTGGAEGKLVVVWSSDQPWGSAVARNLDKKNVTLAAVPRATGVEPMLDYIRARIS